MLLANMILNLAKISLEEERDLQERLDDIHE
jgi:hypothetical protein